MKPNVLLVVLDAARRDALEPYSASASTPAIAQLARRGHALGRAYATSSWTLPSHASMFTGLLPRTAGLGQPPEGNPQSARPALERVEQRLLPRVLQDAGYATHGFSANVWVSEHAGFERGFDSFSYVPSARTERAGALTGGGLRGRIAWAAEGWRSQADDGAAELDSRLRASIGQWAGTPTFWFVNLVECHSPYLPPAPWNDLPPVQRIRAALDSQRYLTFESICRHVAGDQRIPAASLQRMRHLYARSVSYMDAWLARILEALERRGILDQTLVIVTSDHGESFDENGLIAHGFGLDQRLIEVPLITAGPGAFGGEEVFSLASLPARIAAAAGIAEHPWREPETPPAIALAQYDALAAPDDPRIVAFAKRWGIDSAGIARLTASYACATDGQRKLLHGDGIERRFDLGADPEELSPLPAASAADPAFVALRDALEAAEHGARPAPAPSGAPAASPDELAELERQMKLLGYI